MSRYTAMLGMVIVMVLGAGVLPAAAATETTQEHAARIPGDNITQALVVGSLAFTMIIALAGAVLYYTAKGRHRRQE